MAAKFKDQSATKDTVHNLVVVHYLFPKFHEWNGMEFHGTSTTKVISCRTICNDMNMIKKLAVQRLYKYTIRKENITENI